MSSAIIVMVRKPELGKVKTRLAKGVGDQIALEIYVKLLNYTSNQASAVDANRYVYYHGEIVDNDMWPTSLWAKRLQPDGTLGDKLKHAISELLKLHDRVVVIGSDCPQISTRVISQALEATSHYDVVIGPTLDGGYYLLGMKTLHKELLEGIPWSSGSEYDVTVRRALQSGLSVMTMPALADVDYQEDWENHARHLH